jgi:hypothetical protein
MIRFASRLAAASLALALVASPVLAQQPAPPAQAPAAQPSANQLALAREVAIGSGMTRSFDAMAEPLLGQLQQMNVTRPEIQQDLLSVVETLRPEIELQKQQMVNTAARIFAERFTESELRDISAFYKSPTGAKFVEQQPLVLDDIVRELATWTQNVSEYIMIRARAEMAKKGHQLQ